MKRHHLLGREKSLPSPQRAQISLVAHKSPNVTDKRVCRALLSDKLLRAARTRPTSCKRYERSPKMACHLVSDTAILGDMKTPHAFDPLLGALPGVQSFRWLGSDSKQDQPTLRLETKQGVVELRTEQFRSNLSTATVDRLGAMKAPPQLVFAPAIAGGTATAFAEAGIGYLDLRGNCHIDVPGYFVHIEGKTQTAGSANAGASVRRPGYQVLFAYLARPELLKATVREVAAIAGVSRKPVSTMRKRLVDDEFIVESKTRAEWRPARHLEALNLWLGGYKTIVRPSLLRGRYRSREQDPFKLESALEEHFAGRDYAWGGAAAAFRQTHHYRGPTTVVHGNLGNGFGKIQVMPAQASPNLLVLGHIGEIRGPEPHLAHPLLVYSELYQDPNERAREAAQVYFERFLTGVGA